MEGEGASEQRAKDLHIPGKMISPHSYNRN